LNNKIFSFRIFDYTIDSVKWKRLSNDNLNRHICSNENGTLWYGINAQI